jgi:hypothetical protein
MEMDETVGHTERTGETLNAYTILIEIYKRKTWIGRLYLNLSK